MASNYANSYLGPTSFWSRPGKADHSLDFLGTYLVLQACTIWAQSIANSILKTINPVV